MTTVLPMGPGTTTGPGTRNFDYGIGDDITHAARQARLAAARRIRDAIRDDPRISAAERQAYERAAQLAEGV